MILRFRGGFLAFLRPEPEEIGRVSGASTGEKTGISACKDHLRTLCEGVLPKVAFGDGWADAQDGRIARAGW